MILLIPAISINGTRLSMIRLGLEDRWWWRSPLDVSAATSPTRANHCRPWFCLQLLSSDLVSKLEAKYSRSFHRYHRHSGRSSSTRIIRITQISAATAIQMMQVAITWPWMLRPLLTKITTVGLRLKLSVDQVPTNYTTANHFYITWTRYD